MGARRFVDEIKHTMPEKNESLPLRKILLESRPLREVSRDSSPQGGATKGNQGVGAKRFVDEIKHTMPEKMKVFHLAQIFSHKGLKEKQQLKNLQAFEWTANKNLCSQPGGKERL